MIYTPTPAVSIVFVCAYLKLAIPSIFISRSKMSRCARDTIHFTFFIYISWEWRGVIDILHILLFYGNENYYHLTFETQILVLTPLKTFSESKCGKSASKHIFLQEGTTDLVMEVMGIASWP